MENKIPNNNNEAIFFDERFDFVKEISVLGPKDQLAFWIQFGLDLTLCKTSRFIQNTVLRRVFDILQTFYINKNSFYNYQAQLFYDSICGEGEDFDPGVARFIDECAFFALFEVRQLFKHQKEKLAA